MSLADASGARAGYTSYEAPVGKGFFELLADALSQYL
jgi:hypothetical protein